MNDDQILRECELDMEKCLAEMGDQQATLARLRATGYYDSFAVAEAMDRVAKLRDRLDGIHKRLQELSQKPKKK